MISADSACRARYVGSISVGERVGTEKQRAIGTRTATPVWEAAIEYFSARKGGSATISALTSPDEVGFQVSEGADLEEGNGPGGKYRFTRCPYGKVPTLLPVLNLPCGCAVQMSASRLRPGRRKGMDATFRGGPASSLADTLCQSLSVTATSASSRTLHPQPSSAVRTWPSRRDTIPDTILRRMQHARRTAPCASDATGFIRRWLAEAHGVCSS